VGNLYSFFAITPCVGYFTMASSHGWLGVAAGILFYVCRGFTSVILQDALNWRLPSSFRATGNSIKSLMFRLSFGVVGPVMGFAIERTSLNMALAMIGMSFTLLLVVLMLPLCRRVEELKLDYIPEGA